MIDGYLNLYDVVQKDVDSRPFSFNPSYFVIELKEKSVILKDTIISSRKIEVSFEELAKTFKKV